MPQVEPVTVPLLDVERLSVSFGGRRGQAPIRAVSDVSLALEAGQTLGVVGESGCGKSTLARAILRLIVPGAGRVRWQGRDLAEVSATELQIGRASCRERV